MTCCEPLWCGNETNVVLKDGGDVLLREGALGKDNKKASLANCTIANNNKLHVRHWKEKEKKRLVWEKKKTQKRNKKTVSRCQKNKKAQNKFLKNQKNRNGGKGKKQKKKAKRRVKCDGSRGSARVAWHG